MAMMPVDSNLSGSTAASLIVSNDLPTETTPLMPAKACPLSSVEPDVYEKEEKVDPRHYALLPALAIGVFLAAADQTIVISSYGTIGSEMNALDKCSWLATAYVPPFHLHIIFTIKAPLTLFAQLHAPPVLLTASLWNAIHLIWDQTPLSVRVRHLWTWLSPLRSRPDHEPVDPRPRHYWACRWLQYVGEHRLE